MNAESPHISTLKEQIILMSVICSKRGVKLAGYFFLWIFSAFLLFILVFNLSPRAHAESRIKDIVAVEGIRENMLVGYGLVVGLNGTGDKINNVAFTEKSLAAFLDRLGVNIKDQELKTKNVAAVTVTASLPPFARAGGRLDVRVSTMGDSTNLQGGVLLATPLLGADGEVYAVAQGPIAIEGFGAQGGDGSSIQKGVPTNGYIASGGIVEKEVPFNLNSMKEIKLGLRNPDVSTANRIAAAINAEMGADAAKVSDPGTVVLFVPKEYQDSVAELLARVEPLTVTTDQVAKVVIDEASGTIVMGDNVRIDTVAVAQGNLVIQIKETPVISQPPPLAPDGENVETVVATTTQITVDEDKDNRLAYMKNGTTLKELVNGLNALGVGPRDMISILQTIKVAGAMQAEILAR